jgi:Uma2 family endonuclease
MDRSAVKTAKPLEPVPDWVPRWLLDVDEFYRMVEAGILHEDDHVELIEGELVAMAPAGVPHINCINRLNRLLVRAVGDDAIVSVQNPVRLSNFTQPEPDFAVIRPASGNYATTPPQAEDLFLIVEVAASSLRYDVAVKSRLYARHGVAEYWVVDLDAATILVHREPTQLGYAKTWEAKAGEVLDIVLLPGLRLAVADILA